MSPLERLSETWDQSSTTGQYSSTRCDDGVIGWGGCPRSVRDAGRLAVVSLRSSKWTSSTLQVRAVTRPPKRIPRFLGRGCARRRFSPYPYPSGTGDHRFWAILEPVDEPKPLRIDRFRTIRVVLAGEVKAYRSNPPPPRSGPRGRGGRGMGMTMLGRLSRSLASWRSLIVSRTAQARRSANTRSIR